MVVVAGIGYSLPRLNFLVRTSSQAETMASMKGVALAVSEGG